MDQSMVFFFSLVLGGAFLHGIGNTLRAYYLRNRNVSSDVSVVATMLGASVFSFAAEIAWNGIPNVSAMFWIPFSVTAVLNILIENLNTRALKMEEASVVVPLASTMPAILIFASWVILGEFPSFAGRVGIILIASGAYILRLRGGEIALPAFLRYILPQPFARSVFFLLSPWFRLFSSRGAQYAFLTAWIAAVSVNFDKLATLNSSPMFFTGGAYTVVCAATWTWSKKRGAWKTHDKSLFGQLFLLGLFTGLFTVILNAGYFYAIVPYVGSVKRTQIVWTVLFALVFLKEKDPLLRIAGSAIIFAGTVLVAF